MSIGDVRCELEPSTSRWGERAQKRLAMSEEKVAAYRRSIHSELVNRDPLALFKG